MSKKRKDNKGRILKIGESQRKDLIYQYRYTDVYGKRHTIYSSDLYELREKEKMVCKEIEDGINYVAGNITVIQLVERYVSLKQGVRHNTKVGYNYVLNLLKKESFGYRKVKNIKTSDAQQWFIKLYFDDKRGYSTITSIRGVVKPAFQMAYIEDIVKKNPFDFKLDIIPNTSKRHIAMTPEQADIFMNFIAQDKHYSKYYDEYVILLETGVRVSELVGLTLSDIDLKNRKVRVDHQLQRTRLKSTGHSEYYVEETKTENGVRYIPMSNNVYESFERIINNRKRLKKEWIIDGYTGFLFLDKDDKPKLAMHIEHQMKRALDKYNRLNPDKPLPKITPHVFRHTFCTNLANAGMDIKSLEYVMGHGDISTTMNVYTHARYDTVEASMGKILKFSIPKKAEKVCGND